MNVAEFPRPFFLDTNIFVCSFDREAGQKRERARQLISSSLAAQSAIISSQVVQEFLNVALLKFDHPLTVSEARDYLDTVLLPLCRHYPSLAFYDQALLIKEETGYAFYDALIVTAALETGCKVLLSEDLQDGRVVRGVEILNPFTID